MTSQNDSRLTIEIWSDLACPWCWLARKRFHRALEGFGHEGATDIVLRAFRLEAGMPKPQPLKEHLIRKYGLSDEQAATSLRQLEALGLQEGLRYRFDGMETGDTVDSHRLIKLAANYRLQVALMERLFLAYFAEGVSLFDREALRQLAVETGLPEHETVQVLAGDAYLTEVEADQQCARQLQIQGVPFFLLDGRYAVSGAQETEMFERALHHAWLQRDVEPAAVSAAACGADGCELPPR